MDFKHWYYNSDGTVRGKWLDDDTEEMEDIEDYTYNDIYIEAIKEEKHNE